MNDLLEVGIFDGEVIDYAVKLEFGNKGNDFLRTTYDTHQMQIGDYVADQFDLVFQKKIAIAQAKKQIIAYVVNLVKQTIVAKDLIQTGRMLNSVRGRNA
jgi:hypothetical protein